MKIFTWNRAVSESFYFQSIYFLYPYRYIYSQRQITSSRSVNFQTQFLVTFIGKKFNTVFLCSKYYICCGMCVKNTIFLYGLNYFCLGRIRFLPRQKWFCIGTNRILPKQNYFCLGKIRFLLRQNSQAFIYINQWKVLLQREYTVKLCIAIGCSIQYMIQVK